MTQSDKSIYNLRHDFSKSSLNENDVNSFPALQFDSWMKQALDSKIEEALAMVLSTVNKEGQPSGRILYLREYGNDNFAFFTNYHSRKGEELIENNRECINFFWEEQKKEFGCIGYEGGSKNG